MNQTFHRRSLVALLAGAAAVAVSPQSASAQFAVFDSANLAQAVQQVASLKAQLDTLTSTYTTVTKQLAKAEQAYDAVTGGRGLGTILNNPLIRKHLPTDVRKIYDASQQGGYQGISGTVDQILNSELLTGTTREQRQKLNDRYKRNAASQKLVGLDAYDAAEMRLDQLDQLADRINSTQDPKELGELQARIAVEQARIAAEAQKLQMLAQVAEAEERLARQQEREMHSRIFNSANTKMPTIQ